MLVFTRMQVRRKQAAEESCAARDDKEVAGAVAWKSALLFVAAFVCLHNLRTSLQASVPAESRINFTRQQHNGPEHMI